MRVLQASPRDPDDALMQAKALGCEAIAWNLREPCEAALRAAQAAGLASEGFWQAARDPEASAAHPEWCHAPQHHEWLRRFPSPPLHPALVGGWIGLNTKAAFAQALASLLAALAENPWCSRLWLSEIQGPPMGCGCGNPSCRSWDNAPGEKIAASAYEKPEILFPLEFFRAVRARAALEIVPILCAECERGVSVGGVDDPDGPGGTDLCQGVPCARPCALDYWPRLLEGFRTATPTLGLLLMRSALEKPEGWPARAHRYYGDELIACVEPADASSFDRCLILTDAPQSCWPEPLPPGLNPVIPAIMCGYCPP